MKAFHIQFLWFVLPLAASLQAGVAPPSPEPLAWDSLTKQQTLPPGETTAHFTFSVTNVSAGEVVVEKVSASCGCTVAQMPAQPWRLAPGTHGNLKLTMDLRGKWGTLTKTATVQTSAGIKVLTLSAILPESSGAPSIARQAVAVLEAGRAMPGVPSPPIPRSAGLRTGELRVLPRAGSETGAPIRSETMDRARNQTLALADHQAVFRGDCARCHAEPAKGKLGKELYVSVCGICHDAEHRAEMVPLLGKSDQSHSPAYWRTWITFGKPGSLMPAFAQSLGGPLDRAQVESLAAYLAGKHSRGNTPP